MPGKKIKSNDQGNFYGGGGGQTTLEESFVVAEE